MTTSFVLKKTFIISTILSEVCKNTDASNDKKQQQSTITQKQKGYISVFS